MHECIANCGASRNAAESQEPCNLTCGHMQRMMVRISQEVMLLHADRGTGYHMTSSSRMESTVSNARNGFREGAVGPFE
jgi:hypothetical protein